MINKILKYFWYEKIRPRLSYYQCNWNKKVCKMIDYIYNDLKEYTQNKTAEITKQQVWLTERKDKTIFFHRYNVIRNWNEIIQWSYSEDEPKHCGDKIIFN